MHLKLVLEHEIWHIISVLAIGVLFLTFTENYQPHYNPQFNLYLIFFCSLLDLMNNSTRKNICFCMYSSSRRAVYSIPF